MGGVRVRFLTTLGIRIRFFLSDFDSRCPIGSFLHHTKLGIPVEMLQSLLKLLFQQISCYAPQFPLILTAKFHSLYVKDLGAGNFRKSESDILPLPLQR